MVMKLRRRRGGGEVAAGEGRGGRQRSAGGDMARQWTRQEVAARASREDAAIVIDNVVYDVTQWLEEHPGGADVLLQRAGGDASRCFHDVGHSEDALRWRERFRAGDLVPADRWEPQPRAPPAPAARAPASLAALASACAPPLALGALAVLVHWYLFP